MKGIILAGGSGTRLSPSTAAISKHLIPIYDKPMIYYPLSTLMLAGIRDVLIISTHEHLPLYKEMFHNGHYLGLNIEYKAQNTPKGIAEAFIIGEEFIGSDSVALILGDNIFYGTHFSESLKKAAALQSGGIIFGYYVDDPKRYGVLEFDANHNVISVEEKPAKPKSDYAIPGLYFFDNKCIEYAKKVEPSDRYELEITSVIEQYIKAKNLKVELLGRGFAWLDTGTHESLMEASNFVMTIEKRQGLKVSCLEEIAYKKGFISFDELKESIQLTAKSEYGDYLKKFVKKIKQEAIIKEKNSLVNRIVSKIFNNKFNK
tara:strand:- start:4153 stop:5103 length:951 start_codon:yes stop_codon:yes gene_type:complete